MKRAAVAVIFLCAFGQASAAKIYRCGPDGRTYSQAPCADGQAIDAADPRSAAERAEAHQIAARERRAADALERERRAGEAAQVAPTATGINSRPAPADAAASAKAQGKPRSRGVKTKPADDGFKAVEPRTGK